MIEKSTYEDLNNIAHCHRDAFPQSFSTKLGHVYCMKMFEWYLSTDKTFLFHLTIDNQIVGYCGGKVERALGSGSTSAMIQYSFNQAILSIITKPWLLFNKTMISNYYIIYKNILVKLGFKKKSGATKRLSKDTSISIGLVVIGVSRSYQRLGYGSKLLFEFEKKSKEYGAEKINLTVLPSNTNAIMSYEKNGWLVNKQTNKKTTMYKNI